MKTFAYLMTAMVLSACGGSVTEEGQGGDAGTGGNAGTDGNAGTGGTSGSGGATGGSGGSMPDACAVETNLLGPYQVAFSFVSKNVQPVYLLEECRLRYHVKPCADDYQAALAITADCTVDCSDPPVGGCIACGACMSVMVPVSTSTSAQASWLGNTYAFGTNSEGCSCHNTFEAPAGKYRIEVPVYLTPEPYTEPVHTAVVDFTLPAPNGTVVVDLTSAYPED